MTDLEVIKQIESQIGSSLKRLSYYEIYDEVKHQFRSEKFEIHNVYGLTAYSVDEREHVRALSIDYTPQTYDFNLLNNLEQLETLSLKGAGDINIEQIFLINLKRINLSQNKLKQLSSFHRVNGVISLDLWDCQIRNISFLKDLRRLINLNLSSNHIEDISSIKELKELTRLNLSFNKIKDISFLDELKKLTSLDLSFNQIEDISFLKELKELTSLDLSDNQIEDISFLKELKGLTNLNLKDNRIIDISVLKELKGLRSLNLGGNRISDISPLKGLKKLLNLNLNNNQISDISFLKDIKNLTSLNLHDNQVSDISLQENMQALESLNLSNNQISDISFLENMQALVSLNLSNNQISDIFSLQRLKGLSMLNLRDNQISDILFLRELKNLKQINLSNNLISQIGEWIVNANINIGWEKDFWKSNGLNLYGNPIETPPIYIVKRGEIAIKSWFVERNKSKTILNPYVKLIVTGNTTIGKTSLIKFLLEQTYDEEENSTHGIRQYSWKHENKNLDVSIWDFGGQEYYHSTHQLFFTNNALYLLMYDKEHNCNGWVRTEIEYDNKGRIVEELEHFDYFYWLRNIRNLSRESKILMIQNKVEDPNDVVYPNNDCFDLEKEYKVEIPFKSISISNAYYYYKLNNEFSYEFKDLRNLIITKLNEVKRGEIFEYYLKAKTLIEEVGKEKPIVSIKEFIEICKPVNENIDKIITDNNDNRTEYTAWELMCIYFHETGVLLYYPESEALKEKIFIHPTFVTDSIYKVLNYNIRESKGQFTFSDVVKSLNNDKELAEDIIELMSVPNFKLVFNYPHDTDNYIAPQYLDDKKPDKNLLHHITKKMKIGFVLEFINFLPKHMLVEFTVNYGRFKKDDIIWKYGIVFEKYGTTAFVECLFSERKIVYCSDNLGDFNRLKFEVFETIRNINRNDKNLKIALDNSHFYLLETVMSDRQNETFYLFREGYDNYIKYDYMTTQELKGYQETLELLINKKNFLQKELTLAYDSEKKFALLMQIEGLEKQISGFKEKVVETSTSQTNIRIGDHSSNNLVISGVSNSTINFENSKLQVASLVKKIDDLTIEVKEMRNDIKQYQADLIVMIGEDGSLMKESIIKLSEEQTELAKTILNSINDLEIDNDIEDKQKANELLQFIASKLDKLELSNKIEIDEKLKGDLSVGGKLKLTIPIIPVLLKYEQEFAFAAKEPIKSWKDLWGAFFTKKR